MRQSFPEFSGFQYSERTIASTETNITSAESPWSQLSFGTLKVGVPSSWRCHPLLPQNNFFYPTRTYAFRGGRAWRPPGNATPTFRVPNESWNPGLSADILFVSVVVMVLSENWKTLEENFRKKIISAISQNEEIYKRYFLQRFSIFWKNHY